MIAALLLAVTLSELPPQRVPPGRCVAVLWSRAEPPLRIAMLDESARTLRLQLDGRTVDLAEQQPGRYVAPGLAVTVRLDRAERPGLTQGSVIEGGTLRLEPDGQDSQVVPIGGLAACY